MSIFKTKKKRINSNCIFKKVLGLSVCFIMLFSISANAASIGDSGIKNPIESNNADYWRSYFPDFDKYLNENPKDKLVGQDELYIKFTLKEGSNDKNVRSLTEVDYIQESYTPEEYELEMTKERANIGSCNPVNPEPYWLKLDLQVYKETNSGNRFMACSFWEWKTTPIFAFTDLNGIYVSEGGIIPDATSVNPMVSKYIQQIDNSYMKYYTNKLDTDPHSKGMMGIIDINNGSEIQPVTKHMGMTQTPVERIDAVAKMIISSSYIHKQVVLGLPSFDSEGKPSFGLAISTDEHSVRVPITF